MAGQVFPLDELANLHRQRAANKGEFINSYLDEPYPDLQLISGIKRGGQVTRSVCDNGPT